MAEINGRRLIIYICGRDVTCDSSSSRSLMRGRLRDSPLSARPKWTW